MDIEKIVSLFNNGNTLSEIGKLYGKSKSTVQRFINRHGYILNKKTGKYEIVKNVSRETINTVSYATTKSRTITLPLDLHRVLNVKAAMEGKTSLVIIQEALKAYIEPKYFDICKVSEEN